MVCLTEYYSAVSKNDDVVYIIDMKNNSYHPLLNEIKKQDTELYV